MRALDPERVSGQQDSGCFCSVSCIASSSGVLRGSVCERFKQTGMACMVELVCLCGRGDDPLVCTYRRWPADDDGGDSDDDAAPAHHFPRSHLVVVGVSNDAVGNPLLWGLT